MSSFFIKTLGCKVNSFDSQSLKTGLLNSALKEVSCHKQASLVVINSCSVTEAAEKEVLYWVRRYKRENQACKLVVTGCYAQINSKKLLEKEAIDLVVPNESKGELTVYVNELLNAKGKVSRFPSHLKQWKITSKHTLNLLPFCLKHHKLRKELEVLLKFKMVAMDFVLTVKYL